MIRTTAHAVRIPSPSLCAGAARRLAAAALLCAPHALTGQDARGLKVADLTALRTLGEVELSPNGAQVVYAITRNDVGARPSSEIWIRDLASGATTRLGSGGAASSPRWSPDGRWIAFMGRIGDSSGIAVAAANGTGARLLATTIGTNAVLPRSGDRLTWSPDGTRLAFVSTAPGPEADANGDPMVITRYAYKPTASEGLTRFNDNKHLHIFMVDSTGGSAPRQLTTGNHYEHSIAWSPNGREIAFVSNREENEDQFFNYDLFTLDVATLGIRRLTATENIEYKPRWSPDGRMLVYQGCKRGLTDLETTMEDTHIWTINADGTNRRELVTMDKRQGEPNWSPEGDAIYFTAQDRGHVRLYRARLSGGGQPELVVADPGIVSAWSAAQGGAIAYAYTGPNDMAQLFLKSGGGPARQLTNLNADVMRGKEIAATEALTFVSNDNKWEVEAFLTKPAGVTATSKHPLIVVIHGGPHGQQGPAFNFKNQVYAGRGWATLMVNYRGSTGYGQAFADGVFNDQNGNEGQDVLYGVSAAIRRNLWIDRDRIGVEGVSYGGQLSAWLITQSNLFKSSIPTAAIINLVSYNYTTYYNQYEQMTFGIYPHQGNLMDTLWERSALKHVAKVHTPTLLVHGENDNDVPVAEAEQYYIALKDVGVETVFVRYPREGHGIREVKHVIDWTERSMRWHESHFPKR